jgi:hypothetical protein
MDDRGEPSGERFRLAGARPRENDEMIAAVLDDEPLFIGGLEKLHRRRFLRMSGATYARASGASRQAIAQVGCELVMAMTVSTFSTPGAL